MIDPESSLPSGPIGEFIVPLSKAGLKDSRRTGNKAAVLGELLSAGFAVPQGYVLTTEAFRMFIEENGMTLEGSAGSVRETTRIPSPVSEAISIIFQNMGGAMLAVRSSSVSEDLPESSFAGQFETVLGVKGKDELEEAVKICWLSAFGRRAAEYGKSHAGRATGDMAVLIQRLVRADAAGVAFTVNPVTGADEVVVNSVRGLGDRLVSGTATPDEWVVTEKPTLVSKVEGAISEEQASEIAQLARRAESHFGSPQDIEWAIAGDRLFLLQARPVTGMRTEGVNPIQPEVKVPEGYWQREEVIFPRPVSPMDASIMSSVSRVFGSICSDLGLPIERLQFGAIGGYVYLRVIPPGGKDRPPPPPWLMPILVQLVPQVRSQIKRCVEAVRTDKRGRYVNLWYDEWCPVAQKKLKDLDSPILASLPDGELISHFESTVQLHDELFESHFRVAFSAILILWEFFSFCHSSLELDDRNALKMLSGLTEKTTEPSRRLAELASMAARRPETIELLKKETTGIGIDLLRKSDGELADALSHYLRDYGYRTLRYEVSVPTIAEDPTLILRLLQERVSQVNGVNSISSIDAVERNRQKAISEARSLLSKKTEEEGEAFERLLKRAEKAYPTIEDTQFYLMVSRGLIRYSLLELGRRLAERGIIEKRDDVFLLSLEEAKNSLGEPNSSSGLKTLVKKRSGELAWEKEHAPPLSYGKQPPPPPVLNAFPKEFRQVMEAITWWMGKSNMPSLTDQKRTEVMTGVGASPGSYTGTVCVVKDESEFWKLKPGDILVCPVTTPTWSLLFSKIGALVTDKGGLLSHPAIIAREYHIPAVVATGSATNILKDGERITVDGDSGTVRREQGVKNAT